MIVPARILNSCSNGEGGVLYSMYPHRVYRLHGRPQARHRPSLEIALATLDADSSFVHADEGWAHGNAAALAGAVDTVAPQLQPRALQPHALKRDLPLAVIRPTLSADHCCAYNQNFIDMLQVGEDSFENMTVVLCPAWPCSWEMQDKLQATLNTSIEIDNNASRRNSSIVTPASRAGAIRWGAGLTEAL